MKYEQTTIYEYEPGKSDTAYIRAIESDELIVLHLHSEGTGLELQRPIMEPTSEKITLEHKRLISEWHSHVDNTLATIYIQHQDILLELGFTKKQSTP